MTHSSDGVPIYFAGSIRGGRDDATLYSQLIEHLQKYGSVLTEHVGDKALPIRGEDGLEDRAIHDRDLSWLFSSLFVVAEVTNPSLGVGYELGRVVERGSVLSDRVLCLYRKQEGRVLSAMIAGCGKFSVRIYDSLDQARDHIDAFFAKFGVQKK